MAKRKAIVVVERWKLTRATQVAAEAPEKAAELLESFCWKNGTLHADAPVSWSEVKWAARRLQDATAETLTRVVKRVREDILRVLPVTKSA